MMLCGYTNGKRHFRGSLSPDTVKRDKTIGNVLRMQGLSDVGGASCEVP